MHAAAQTAVEAVFPAKGLAGHAVEQEVPAQGADVIPASQHLQDFSAVMALHDLAQLVLRKSLHSPQAPGEDLAVAAVGAEGEVLDGQVVCLPHIGRLLADAQMGRAGMLVRDALILPGGLDQLDHGLKFPDIAHIPVDADEVFAGECACHVFHTLLIAVKRDVQEGDGSRRPHFDRIDKKLF